MRNNPLLKKITIAMMGLACIMDMIVVPIAGEIFGAFPNASEFWLNFILTGPALVALPVILLAGVLARYISKRYLLIAGIIAAGIGAIGCSFSNSLNAIICFRALNGVGYGLVQPMAYAIAPELFDNLEDRAQTIGLMMAGCALGGIIFSMSSGFIAMTGWHHSFYLGLLLIFPLLGLIFCIPTTPPEGKKQKSASNTNTMSIKYPFKYVALCLAVFCIYGVLYYGINFTIDLYVADTGLGSSALSGILTSSGALASFLVGMLFGKIFIKLQHKMPILMFGLAAVGFGLLYFAASPIIVILGCFIAGCSASLADPYFASVYTQVVPAEHIGITMSVHSLSIQAQNYICPFVITAIMSIFHCKSRVDAAGAVALIMAVSAIVCFVYYIVAGRKLDLPKDQVAAQTQIQE